MKGGGILPPLFFHRGTSDVRAEFIPAFLFWLSI
jgi:hypothetical protein